MLRALGKHLREARKARRASLETVAEAAGISAPYLLKLERGLVNTPSPRVLARLATPLESPYLGLMELAGYLDEDSLAALRTRAPRPHPLAGQSLSEEEWREVGAFIRQLLSRRSGASRPTGS
jgi:transcriptional regulator with XRE-family HTH domain